MKGNIKTIGIMLCVCIFTWPTLTLGETETWELDKTHSSIYFDVKHTYATVRGMFSEFSGTISLDAKNNEKSQVEFEVLTMNY
jgi:polyisoprenoid-binding protein YceI